MRAQIRLPKTRLHTASLLLFSFFFIHQSCTKIDTQHVGTLSETETANRFFNVPFGTPPIVRRLAASLRQRDGRDGFANTLANNTGYAVWDKAIVRKADAVQSATARNFTGEGDSAVILPLVLSNTDYVNGYLVAVTSADTFAVSLYRAQDYASYGFGLPAADSALSAEKIALQTMQLDAAVFGDTAFNITDMRLFSALHYTGTTQSPVAKKVRLRSSNSQGNNYGNTASTTVCVTFEYEEFFENPFGVECPPGQSCQWTHTVTATVCSTIWIDGGNTSPIGGIGPGGGAGGSPTPGGGGTPSPGVGWHAIPGLLDPNSPCGKVINMLNKPAIKQLYKNARDSAGGAYEIGYSYTNSGNSIFATGKGKWHRVDVEWSPGGNLGDVHCHDAGAGYPYIFSYSDVEKIYTVGQLQVVNSMYCLSGVATSDKENFYVMTIQDTAAFNGYFRQGLEEMSSLELEKKYWLYVYRGMNRAKSEKGFLRWAAELNLGISLVKVSADFSQVTELKLSGSQVVPNPCLTD